MQGGEERHAAIGTIQLRARRAAGLVERLGDAAQPIAHQIADLAAIRGGIHTEREAARRIILH